MANREDDEVEMALKMSLQTSSPSAPEAKRSKPLEESPESRNRRLQRELMASAAEKRIKAFASTTETRSKGSGSAVKSVRVPEVSVNEGLASKAVSGSVGVSIERNCDLREFSSLGSGEELSESVAENLFSMVFGSSVSLDVLGQWSSQGIRFSSDPETCMGLVQHEGGPCGVLATIQAYVLKYLLFLPDDLGKDGISNQLYNMAEGRLTQRSYSASKHFSYITEDRKTRALVHSMVEILFLCGAGRRAVVATIEVQNKNEHQHDDVKNQIIAKHLEGISIKSASDLQRIVKVNTFDSQAIAFAHLLKSIPIFQSGLGATLFLISALLSRGLESVQADRDDPSQPLVTAPFGHASQEIVNLLICGQAVPNVFDGSMDLGGGMFVKGIPSSVEVGFLTLLESLNFCKVGQHLKRPKWPIWVVGSESHYTVLFALDPSVQKENELEERESSIRKAFDAQDQSGGGGFISVEGFQQVLRETNINFPSERLDSLCNAGYIVWSEFWQALLDLDKNLGGFKDSSGSLGKKQFDIYHFNGIAKSVLNGPASLGSDSPMQRPRLCKLAVSVPPRWTPDEFLADVTSTSSTNPSSSEAVIEVNQPQPSQHAPLVDCIRTRWPRAVCSWIGDAPSIV